MRSLTRNIGRSQSGSSSNPAKEEFKRILISRPNQRLGNLLLITPLIQELEVTFPHAKIDLFVKGTLAPILFENYNSIERTLQLPKKPFSNILDYLLVWIKLRNKKYDLIINVDSGSSSGRLSTSFATSYLKLFNDNDSDSRTKNSDIHFGRLPVHLLRSYLSGLGLSINKQPVKPLDLRLTPNEIAQGKDLLNGLTQNGKSTILIFTYATGRKCYSKEWWEEFYLALKKEFQEDYNIVEVLPMENISQISFQAPSFYSKDVREIGAFITNVSIFIGADGGIMHLSAAVDTPTVGLFSVTRKEMYAPYNRGSIGIDTNAASHEDIIEEVGKILATSPS